jgi:hypothetical protein
VHEGDGKALWHWPPAQTWLVWQTWPQAPQFSGLFWNSWAVKQPPLQFVSPSVVHSVWMHMPWTQRWRVGSQAFPHPPQLVAS